MKNGTLGEGYVVPVSLETADSANGAAMVVGVLEASLAIYGAASLKDKRRVVRSVKDRIAHRFNVSVAEVDELDFCQKAVLGFAMVGNDQRYIEGALSKIVEHLKWVSDATLTDFHMEWY